MAIDIKAPLAERLFALGSNVGADNPQFKYKSRTSGRSFRAQASPMMQQGEDHSGGQAKALASIGGALASAYGNYQGTPAATNATGQGFGLGGSVVGGDVGNASYAGYDKSLFGSSTPQNGGQYGLFDGFKYGE